jgi:hypothetical protein
MIANDIDLIDNCNIQEINIVFVVYTTNINMSIELVSTVLIVYWCEV